MTTNQFDLFQIDQRPHGAAYLTSKQPTHREPDHDTSIAAGTETVRRGTDRALALELLRNAGERGLTDFELADLMHRQQTSAGKRRGELVAAGLVEKTDMRRAAPSGAMAIVWLANKSLTGREPATGEAYRAGVGSALNHPKEKQP